MPHAMFHNSSSARSLQSATTNQSNYEGAGSTSPRFIMLHALPGTSGRHRYAPLVMCLGVLQLGYLRTLCRTDSQPFDAQNDKLGCTNCCRRNDCEGGVLGKARICQSIGRGGVGPNAVIWYS